MDYSACKYCGKSHGIGIEHMQTGKIEPIDFFYDFLWSPPRVNQIEEQVVLKD